MTDQTASSAEDSHTALLLEQLLQIARISALEEMASGIAHELNQPIELSRTRRPHAGDERLERARAADMSYGSCKTGTPLARYAELERR